MPEVAAGRPLPWATTRARPAADLAGHLTVPAAPTAPRCPVTSVRSALSPKESRLQEKIRAYLAEERPPRRSWWSTSTWSPPATTSCSPRSPPPRSSTPSRRTRRRQILRLLLARGARLRRRQPGEIDRVPRGRRRPGRHQLRQHDQEALATSPTPSTRGVRLFTSTPSRSSRSWPTPRPAPRCSCRILHHECGGCRLAAVAEVRLRRSTMASDLLAIAPKLQLDPVGVSFHVGSQQRDPGQWDAPLARWRGSSTSWPARPARCRFVNLGGGFPAIYREVGPADRGLRRRRSHRSLERQFPAGVARRA